MIDNTNSTSLFMIEPVFCQYHVNNDNVKH